MYVLWVDEEARRCWNLVTGPIVERGVSVRAAAGAKEAGDELRRGSPVAAIVDVILPATESGPALATYVGIHVARELAHAGVERIAFLSVISESEIEEYLEQLRGAYANTVFKHFEKDALFDAGELERIANFVTGK